MPVHKAEALFDFNPTAGVELKLQKGDIVQVRRMSVGEGWWEGELNGFRGLFPSSYVKLLPESSPTHDSPKSLVSDTPAMPLTPGLSKKAFMEALLAPTNIDHGQHYSEDRANEIFLEQHSDVAVTVGPSWSCHPPSLTITVRHPQLDTRSSVGSKQLLTYVVETEEWRSSVTRKYKQFLWLYDKLAEGFPCISLPPLPVKQNFSPKDFDGMKARRAGLEKFLTRVANHPVLSCTKVFHLFLTTKDDKEWKIGRHNSHIKVPKSARKLFSAPVYTAVKYPAYNVPLTQLASIEKFAKFTRLLEMNVQALQSSCLHVSGSMGDLMQSLNFLGKDLQKFSRGIQVNTGSRRKLLASSVMPSGLANGPQASIHVSLAAPKVAEDDEDSDEEVEGGTEWNWREDESFLKMCKDLYDISGGIRGLSKLGRDHQATLDKDVVDTLRDYSSIIHTLPVLVKLHEEAMEIFKASKDKDSKKEAEEIRQHCETLNNILLAEFDNFSTNMIQDFENMMERFLRQQVKFHTQMASEWDALHRLYAKRLSSTSSAFDQGRGSKGPFSVERISRQLGDGSRHRSGSFKNSFASSQGSSSSIQDAPQPREGRSHSSPAPPPVPPPKPAPEENAPVYINVQRKPRGMTDEVEPDDLIDPDILKPKKKKEEKVEDKEEQAWSEDELRSIECDDEVCHLVKQAKPPSTHPTLYEINLHGESSLANDQFSQRNDWISENAQEVSHTNLAHSEAQGVATKNYPPRYEEYTLNPEPYTLDPAPHGAQISDHDHYETSYATSRNTEQGEGTTLDEHIYNNLPLLTAKANEQCWDKTPQDNDGGSQQMLSVVSSAGPIYSNIAIIQSTNQNIATGSSPPSSKQSSKSAKKPKPIQRKRTKSEELLEESGESPAPMGSCLEVPVGDPSDVPPTSNKGKPPGGIPSGAKKKPLPPAKPAKLSTYVEKSPPTKRNVLVSLAKKVDKGGAEGSKVETESEQKVRARPHSSSISDDGELLLSEEVGTVATKPRSLTQSSIDQKLKKPMVVPSHLNTSPANERLSSNKSETMKDPDVAGQTQSGLKVCGVKVSSATGGYDSLTSESDVMMTEDRPPSPTIPPPPSSTLRFSPLDSTESESQELHSHHRSQLGEKRTATAQPPAKPPRGGSIKKKNSGSSKPNLGMNASESTPSARDELMRKLSVRRLKIEEQIAVKTGAPSISDVSSSVHSSEIDSPLHPELSVSEDSEERASFISTSSANSEVVVAYHAKGGGGMSGGGRSALTVPGSSSNGHASSNYTVDEPDSNVPLRRDKRTIEEDDSSLAKFGIIEDVAGGSYYV